MPNFPKKCPIFKKGSILTKMAHLQKFPFFTGLDLKPARRSERPKGAKDEVKRGPKGPQLEVGAWRAPRLLVLDIVTSFINRPLISPFTQN